MPKIVIMVEDEAANGVPNLQLTLTNAGDGQVAGAFLDVGAGRYETGQLDPGIYKVEVTAPPGYQNPVPNYVEVVGGQATPTQTIALTTDQNGYIWGWVLGYYGQSIKGAISVSSVSISSISSKLSSISSTASSPTS